MTLLIYAGLLYLIGISILLAIKPALMFSKDGTWKEFGIGRSRERYTWLPFWLFSVMWAVIAYLIVLTIATHTGLGIAKAEAVEGAEKLSVPNVAMEPENLSKKPMKPVSAPSETMKKGYYILDANETMKRGVPKYIFLGPEAPNLVYHHTEGEEA
jgi:hypothetical protein